MRYFEHALNGRAIVELNQWQAEQEAAAAAEARRREELADELAALNPTLRLNFVQMDPTGI